MAYAEPILLDYLFLEYAQVRKEEFEKERMQIIAEYEAKLRDQETKEEEFHTEFAAAEQRVKEIDCSYKNDKRLYYGR
ncbi:MAG: hypothetical protein LLG05_18600 [Porphyromonadaceae bacterium]|nr:hypothetical protein [Porphyromonadaceae bacterium]